MRLRLTTAILAACLAIGLVASAGTGGAKPLPTPPRGFFGVGPQAGLTPEDISYMKAGGIESIRWQLSWGAIQPTRKGGYDWSSFDPVVALAARGGLTVLPVLMSPPHWVAHKETTMPVNSGRQRQAWKKFLRAAAERYGPGGEFWRERTKPKFVEGVRYEPEIRRAQPIRNWQIWNESNFFYFAFPVSPSRYAKLVTISSQAIKSAQPRAKILLSGLFGEPTPRVGGACPPPPSCAASTATRRSRAASTASPFIRTRSTAGGSKSWPKNSTMSRWKTTTGPPSTSPRWAGARRTTSSTTPSSRGGGDR